MRPYAFAGGTAVVTGAASGIGEALARDLARRGSHLALLDRDEQGLVALAAAVRAGHPAVRVTTYVVDLADTEATACAARAVLVDHPQITLLLNNAGVALGGRFDQITDKEFSWVMDVNLRATVQLTHAFLPALKASPGSHLANTSSLFGLIAPAGQSAYAASKFAVRGFTEALRAELNPQGIGVTCIHPGGIATNIARNSRVGSGLSAEAGRRGQEAFGKLLTISAQDAARAILGAIQARRPRVLIGASAKIPDVMARISPAHYSVLMGMVTRASARRRSSPTSRPGRS